MGGWVGSGGWVCYIVGKTQQIAIYIDTRINVLTSAANRWTGILLHVLLEAIEDSEMH